MARTSAVISVAGDTSQLEKQIQVALSKDYKLKGLDSKSFTQPLGRITGAAGEFQKSLDASNARVIAFGASAGIIYQVQRAFSELIKSTIDVEKQLADINVILNASSQNLAKFGQDLFKIASDTGQSFTAAAGAATELARQGLSVEETLKRTRDALILTRLSGLDTVSAVESLTATINSFNEAALDSTIIINKLANVDAAFAVSSADLADAIKRVGSSAQDVGVDFDELLAIVTSVQQTTARGGAVIGNSLKTIFTRIQRTDTLDQLEALGVQVRTLEGSTLPALQILQNLATTFDTLGDSQRAQIAETVGGVFQINILRAALGDLSKEYSIYKNALDVSRSATDEAIIRNEKLNQTLAALINETFVNLTKVGAEIGDISFAPTLKNVLELLNKGLASFSTQGEGFGNKLAKGILEGLGSFISGPGVVLISAVFFKLFANLAKFATESLKTLLNINTQAQQRAVIEQKISSILAQEPNLLSSIINKQVNVLALENKILETIRAQTIARQQAASISSTIATNLLGRGVSVSKTGTIKTRSLGYIPGADMEIQGALAGGYTPGKIKQMTIPGEGKVVYNDAEEIKKFKGFSQPAIIPPENSRAGKKYKNDFIKQNGFDPYKSNGYIPNFSLFDTLLSNVRNRTRGVDQQITSAINNNKLTQSQIQILEQEKIKARSTVAPSLASKSSQRELRTYNAKDLGILSLRGGGGDVGTSTSLAQIPIFSNAIRRNPELANKIVQFQNVQVRSLESLGRQKPAEFIRILNEETLPALAKVASRFMGSALGNQADGVTEVLGSLKAGKSFIPPGAIGDLFEASVKIATKDPKKFIQSIDDDFRRPFDFEEGGPASNEFKSRFGFSPTLLKADAKLTAEPRSIRSIINKAYNSALPNLPYTELLAANPQTPPRRSTRSKGYIPNFSEMYKPALEEAIKRELSAGIPPNAIKIGSDYRLSSKNNPLGLGVYNTINEPMGLNEGISRYSTLSQAREAGKEKLSSKGYIPNFQDVYVPPSAQFRMDKQFLQAQRESVQNWNYINANTKAYNATLTRLTSTTEATNKTLNKFGGGLLGGGLMLGLPLILSTLQQYVPANKQVGGINVQQGIGAATTALSFAGTGAFIGSAFPGAGTAIGAGIGATVGLGIGVYQYIEALKNIDFQKLTSELELLKERNNNAANSLGQLLPLVGQYQEIMSSSLSQPVKEANLTLLSDRINEVLENVPEGLRDNILTAIGEGRYQEVGGLIAQSIAEGAKEVSIKEAVTLFEGIRKGGGAIENKETAVQAGRALLNIRTETGERVISAKVKTEEGKQQIADIIKRIEAIPDSIDPKQFTVLNYATKEFGDKMESSTDVLDFASQQFQEAGKEGDILGFSARAVGVDIENAGKSIKDTGDEFNKSLTEGAKSAFDIIDRKQAKVISGAEFETSLSSIVNELKPLFDDTQETREAFDQVSEDAREIALKGGTINDIKRYIIKTLLNTLKSEETIRKVTEENITNAAQFARAFKNRTLTAQKITKYLQLLDTSEEYDPLLVTGRMQAEQYELVRKEIVNQKMRENIDGQIMQKQFELKKLLDEKKITEDQYIMAMKGYTDKIIIAQKRAEGMMFAEDMIAGNQAAREKKILSEGGSPLDVIESFGDAMSYDTQDLWRAMTLGANDTARTIKSEFGNAFQSLIDGTQKAEDAFRNMALNIAQRIQQLALDAAINSALGGFFDLFGFNNGGFVNKFSNKINKKSRGGIVKKFASGGVVEGGSGIRDDIPAMLTEGEYVIKKSAVRKYGIDFLHSLNASRLPQMSEGGVPTLRDQTLTTQTIGSSSLSGGVATSAGPAPGASIATMSSAQPSAPSITSTLSTRARPMPKPSLPSARFYHPKFIMPRTMDVRWGRDKIKPYSLGGMVDDSFDRNYITPASVYTQTTRYKRAIQAGLPLETFGLRENDQDRFDAIAGETPGEGPSGGAFKAIGRNVFRYNDPFEPTGGDREYSGFVSALALNDENNPQNEIAKQRAETLTQYLADKENYRVELEEARRQFEEQEAQRYAENQRLNQAIQDAYKTQQRNAWMTTLLQPAAILGAGAVRTYAVPALQKFLTPNGGNVFGRGNILGQIGDFLGLRSNPDKEFGLPKKGIGPDTSFRNAARDFDTQMATNSARNSMRLTSPNLRPPSNIPNLSMPSSAGRLSPSNLIIPDRYQNATVSFGSRIDPWDFKGSTPIGKYNYSTFNNMGGSRFGGGNGSFALRSNGSPKGGEKDNIPALLMGGEYVVSKDAVKLYGRTFFDDLNSKRIARFADGGMVGPYQGGGSSAPQSSSGDLNTQTINNINISVNVDGSGGVAQAPIMVQTNQQSGGSSVPTNSRTSMSIESQIQESKDLAERIKTEVIKVISQQQRPGGLLRK